MANKGKMADPRPIGFHGVSDNPVPTAGVWIPFFLA